LSVTTTTHNDAFLLASLSAGDEEAFNTLFGQLEIFLHKIAYHKAIDFLRISIRSAERKD
jgi:hypothetical protein